jgi:hypothetical protein
MRGTRQVIYVALRLELLVRMTEFCKRKKEKKMLHKRQTVGHMGGTRQVMIVLLFELFVRMTEF